VGEREIHEVVLSSHAVSPPIVELHADYKTDPPPSIAVYTLTEAAGRQARDALAEIAPGARVGVAADHVRNPRLQALARNADPFVLATASAKHAATDCAQRHRPRGATLICAAGRGVTSILRAIDGHVAACMGALG
jgi:hypothetical protein